MPLVVGPLKKIRQGRGLGVFCHPYWFTGHRYSPAGALTSYLLKTQPFDAYELLGGYDRQAVDSNTLQVARYYEERAKGNELPIVGVSDAHGCETGSLFGWYYTIVLSPTLEHSDLITSVKDLFQSQLNRSLVNLSESMVPFDSSNMRSSF